MDASEAKRGSGRPLGPSVRWAGVLRRQRQRGRGQGQEQHGQEQQGQARQDEAAGQGGRNGHAADPRRRVVTAPL